MKANKGTLNPYAESYVPLSFVPLCNREVVGETKDFKSGESKSAKDALLAADNTKLMSQPDYGYYSSPSQHAYQYSEKQTLDEEFDMDMTFLQMQFPGISDESISDVYALNNRDLEATVDMLNELEVHADFSDKLPDSLDIGDVSEPGFSTEFASKLKKAGEVGPSSSGSS